MAGDIMDTSRRQDSRQAIELYGLLDSGPDSWSPSWVVDGISWSVSGDAYYCPLHWCYYWYLAGSLTSHWRANVCPDTVLYFFSQGLIPFDPNNHLSGYRWTVSFYTSQEPGVETDYQSTYRSQSWAIIVDIVIHEQGAFLVETWYVWHFQYPFSMPHPS